MRILVARLRGLIPAHAGKTATYEAFSAPPWAHPRSRGENSTDWRKDSNDSGSSPLTRGKHRGRARRAVRPGLIPAHAGKTPVRWWAARGCWAHPRSRGENGFQSRRPRGRSGSSPLTRGKRRWTFSTRPASGLIPAHAGKTVRVGRRRAARGAHPRSRGENWLA